MPVIAITTPLRIPRVRPRPAIVARPPAISGAERCPVCGCEALLPDGRARLCRVCAWSDASSA